MKKRIQLLIMFSAFVLYAMAINAQTTAFTYQGRFTDSTAAPPTNGTYAMTFRLFDAATGGNQIPDNATAVTSMVSVVNGIFTVRLDFGASAFNTTGARYLEIQIGSTVLTPRQEITSTPSALRALNAANADRLGGVAANQFVQTNDTRLSDSRTPTAGSRDYIQNTTTQQALTNFNISGSGTIGGTLNSSKVSVNGGVLARVGTPGGSGAGNNGYSFTGDGDSGMFSTADGALQFYTDNQERVRLTQSIALTAKNGNDEVYDGGAGAGITLQAGNGGRGYNGGAGAGITLRAGDGGGDAVNGGSGAGITLQAGNGANGGNYAGNGASITLQPGTGGTGYFNGNSGNVILAPTNGNVGIGTISPTGKLSVQGDIKLGASGNLFAASGEENLRVVRGIFRVSGGTVTITAGSGFTVARNGVGNYTVNFSTAFSGSPTVIPSVISGATILGTSSVSNISATITAFSPNGNAGDPSYVMFIAAGPR